MRKIFVEGQSLRSMRWLDAYQALNAPFLDNQDFLIAMYSYELLGMRVPTSIEVGAAQIVDIADVDARYRKLGVPPEKLSEQRKLLGFPPE